jgi:sulfur-oxidizing protein SoxX
MFLIRLLLLMAGKDTKVCTSAMLSRAGNGLILSALLVLLTAVSGVAIAAQAMDGKTLVMKRSKGNCLACHAIADGELPGNIGPPLVAMKARFPDADILRKQIWDATASNPDTRMPPFGRHGILSDDEIDLIVEYLYTL